jgi:hypothetical protein
VTTSPRSALFSNHHIVPLISLAILPGPTFISSLFRSVMSSNKSFDDLMDMPLDSSPLKPLSPPPVVSAAHGSRVPSRSESPSPMGSVIPPVQCKCAAEDLTQYAGEVSRAHKLVKTDHDDLALFAKVSSPCILV